MFQCTMPLSKTSLCWTCSLATQQYLVNGLDLYIFCSVIFWSIAHNYSLMENIHTYSFELWWSHFIYLLTPRIREVAEDDRFRVHLQHWRPLRTLSWFQLRLCRRDLLLVCNQAFHQSWKSRLDNHININVKNNKSTTSYNNIFWFDIGRTFFWIKWIDLIFETKVQDLFILNEYSLL